MQCHSLPLQNLLYFSLDAKFEVTVWVLIVNFPCDFYLLYFILLGIEKEKSCREDFIHCLHLEVPLHIFKAALAVSGFHI